MFEVGKPKRETRRAGQSLHLNCPCGAVAESRCVEYFCSMCGTCLVTPLGQKTPITHKIMLKYPENGAT